jgi:hypothetical protein
MDCGMTLMSAKGSGKDNVRTQLGCWHIHQII